MIFSITCVLIGFMRKIDALHLIADGNRLLAAQELNVTRQTLWLWPDELNQQQTDLVHGVLYRLNRLPMKKELGID